MPCNGHIAMFVRDLQANTGPPSSAVILANGLAKQGYRVDLLLHRKQGLLINSVASGVEIIVLGGGPSLRNILTISSLGSLLYFAQSRSWWKPSGWLFWSVPSLLTYLRNRKPDITCAFGTKANMALGLANRDPATQHTLKINVISITISNWLRQRNRSKHKLFSLACHADRFIACSKGVARDLEQTFPLLKNRIHTVYEPVLDDSFVERFAQPAQHRWLREASSNASDSDREARPPVLVNAARLVPMKDQATLIKAFARLRKRRRARLIIFGEGRLRGELEQLIAELGLERDIDLPGFYANVFPEISAASLFVLSSQFEGLSKALIEALACGTPAVSTDCPSGPAEVLDNGRYGRLVPVGDVSALASAMEDALDTEVDRDELRRRAWDFSAKSVDEFVELIGKLISLMPAPNSLGSSPKNHRINTA